VSGILDGLRVVELGQYVAAPFAGMLLADHGADVLKVERPGGEPSRGSPRRFVAWNCGKRSLELDLSTPDGRATLDTLLLDADVLVENLRRGALDRLGLSLAEWRARNPTLITCSISGFGDRGPVGVPAWEPLVHAWAGLHVGGGGEGARAWRPFPVASVVAGAYGVLGIAAALLVRARSGRGQHVTTSLYEACLYLNEVSLTTGPNLPRFGFDEGNPAMRIYDTADGQLQVTAGSSRFWGRMCDFIGRPDLKFDMGESSKMARLLKAAEIREEIQAFLATGTADEWEQRCDAADIPGARCRTIAEWIDTPQCQAAGLRVDFERSPWGPLTQVGPPLDVRAADGERLGSVRSPAPALGGAAPEWLAGRRDLTAQPGHTPPGGAAGALGGVRVLDISCYFAGPASARMLAELGADVVKVERPGGEDTYKFMPVMPQPYLGANRSKRVVVLDAKDPEGRRRILELAGTADVVVENARPATWDRIGLGERTLRELNPNLIYARVKGFGVDGPWAARPTFEPTLEAATGMQVAQGDPGRPEALPFPANDLTAPLYAAIGAVLGLLHRAVGGGGVTVSSSLAAAATVFQSEDAVRIAGSSPMSVRRKLGPGHRERLYPTGDGWIAVFVTGGDADDRLAAALGCSPATEVAIEVALTALPTEQAVAALDAVGVPAAPSLGIEELWSQDLYVTHRVELEHASLGQVFGPGVPYHLTDTPPGASHAAPLLPARTGGVAWLPAPSADT
jgi:crotonobetainyl-CoA:carnitine CoA-transferase CaiB-like acyl-CoA transferase